MKWDEMTRKQQYEFCEKYGFDLYPGPVELAEDTLIYLIRHSTNDVEDIEFYKQPLIELGEEKLWEALRQSYEQALEQEGRE